jgi:DNA-binding CsgD family transcriptional regulator
MLRIGMAYVRQQLMEAIYSRSSWPDNLVEATLKVLSLRFFVVDEKAEVQRDGRLRDETAPDHPDWIVAQRRLTLNDERERRQLQEAIRRATGLERNTSIISVSTVSGAMRLAVVAPLARSDPPMAMVLFEHAKTDHAALREHFFRAHGLNSSERLIAHVLLAGGTLKEASERTELSLSTTRSYLKRIFAKTATHRQSELVALYYQSILPVGASIVKADQARGC